MNENEVNTLYTTYRSKVYHLAFSYVKDTYLAEDISHEVLIKCYYNHAKFNGDCSLDTWIVKIARNHCIDFLRRNSSRRILLCENVDSFEYEDVFTPEDQILANIRMKNLKVRSTNYQINTGL